MESENFQGTHIWGSLRGHLCDSTAFLFIKAIQQVGLIKLTETGVTPSACQNTLFSTPS